MKFWSELKPGDLGIFIISLALTVGSFIFVAGGNSGPLKVEIETPQGRFLYTLDQTTILKVPGTLGDSIIQISPNGAEFLDSPCSNKLCVHQGLQLVPGAWAACLPNKVFMRIIGTPSPEAPDAGSY